jgi:hypothetical protein
MQPTESAQRIHHTHRRGTNHAFHQPKIEFSRNHHSDPPLLGLFLTARQISGLESLACTLHIDQ